MATTLIGGKSVTITLNTGSRLLLDGTGDGQAVIVSGPYRGVAWQIGESPTAIGPYPSDQTISISAVRTLTYSTTTDTPQAVTLPPLNIAEETVVHIGPSYCARMTPFFQIDPATWSRTNGVGSFRTQNDTLDWEVGRKFRIQDTRNEWVEGFFQVLTIAPESGKTRVTYVDNRVNKVAGDLQGNSIAALDLNSWSCASGVPAYVSIAMGGSVRYITLGTNGTNVVGWMLPERQAQIRSIGRVGAFVVDGGTVGGAIKDEGLSGRAAISRLRDFIEFLTPQCRVIYLSTPPPYDVGTVPVVSKEFTGATLLMQGMQTLTRDYPNVRLIPMNEALTTRYGNVDTADILGGQQPAADQCTDRVHDQQGAAAAKGAVIAMALGPEFRPRYPIGGAYPDSRPIVTALDLDGLRHPNLISGFFGAVPTNSAVATAITGAKPVAGSITTAAISGDMAMVSAVTVNPDGGSDWTIDWVNPTTSPTANTLFTMAWTGGRSAGELLTALNLAANQGKELDIWVDCGCFGFIQNGVTYADLALWVTTAAEGTWRLASGMSKEGDFQAVQQNRGMSTGFNGLVRFPRFTLPVRTYTAAELRFTIKPQQGATGRLDALRARVGPGFRIEVVEQ